MKLIAINKEENKHILTVEATDDEIRQTAFQCLHRNFHMTDEQITKERIESEISNKIYSLNFPIEQARNTAKSITKALGL